jgi:hypothetical protein
MADQSKAHLTDFGGNIDSHFAEFTLWYDRAEARITIRVEGPAPGQEDPVNAYRSLLHRLGIVAQEAAVSPQALSWPGDPDGD